MIPFRNIPGEVIPERGPMSHAVTAELGQPITFPDYDLPLVSVKVYAIHGQPRGLPTMGPRATIVQDGPDVIKLRLELDVYVLSEWEQPANLNGEFRCHQPIHAPAGTTVRLRQVGGLSVFGSWRAAFGGDVDNDEIRAALELL